MTADGNKVAWWRCEQVMKVLEFDNDNLNWQQHQPAQYYSGHGVGYGCCFYLFFPCFLRITLSPDLLQALLGKAFWGPDHTSPHLPVYLLPWPSFFFFLNHFQVPEVGTFLQA